MAEADDRDDAFRPPLPQEDRLWRHPAEVGAARRAPAAEPVVSTVRTPWRQALALASIGAATGAIMVTGLFLSLGDAGGSTGTADPVTMSVAMNPVVVKPVVVDAEDWPETVAESNRRGVAELEVVRGIDVRTGSAVAFQSNGLLLTSYDIVHDADQITAVLHDGRRHGAQLVGSDHISGLAVLRIDENDLELAHLGIFRPAPLLGQYTVTLSGTARGADLRMATISGLSERMPVASNQSLHGLIQLDGPLPVGGSGAAVVDDTGAVIGIAVDLGVQNAHYAVPIGYARKIAEDLSDFGEGRHAWLGIRGVDLGRDERSELSSRGILGAVTVAAVLPDSPAAAAGLEEGDLITTLDDEPVRSMTDLVLELRTQPPGHRVDLTYYRDGALYRAEVDLLLRSEDDTT